MADYLIEPLDTDPESIYQDFVDYIVSFLPNWSPSPAQLDVLMARIYALKIAIVADMASRVQRSIFRSFGSTITNINPLAATFATVVITFTASDAAGHTIPVGKQFGLVDANGDIFLFALLADAVIPVGSTSVNGTAQAIEEGTSSNNLSGAVQLVEQVDWLSGAVTSGLSAGGGDPEDDDTYLNRLTANLGLMAPRPILGPDFALISRNIAGVWRAAALDNWLPGTNEQQTVSHNYTATGATGGTLTWNGQTTAALPFNATAAQIKTALQNLNNLEAEDIDVTGGPWPAAVTLEFKGNQAYTNVAQVTASAGTWTGGTAVTINTTVPGVAPNLVAENAVAVAGIDQSGLAISSTIKASLDTYLQSLRQQNFVINVIDPSSKTIDVTFTAVRLAGADAADVSSRCVAALQSYLSPANRGASSADSRAWIRDVNIRQQELYTILNNVAGVDYISALTFSLGAGAALTTADKVMTGIFPLTRAGTITPTVT